MLTNNYNSNSLKDDILNNNFDLIKETINYTILNKKDSQLLDIINKIFDMIDSSYQRKHLKTFDKYLSILIHACYFSYENKFSENIVFNIITIKIHNIFLKIYSDLKDSKEEGLIKQLNEFAYSFFTQLNILYVYLINLFNFNLFEGFVSRFITVNLNNSSDKQNNTSIFRQHFNSTLILMISYLISKSITNHEYSKYFKLFVEGIQLEYKEFDVLFRDFLRLRKNVIFGYLGSQIYISNINEFNNENVFIDINNWLIYGLITLIILNPKMDYSKKANNYDSIIIKEIKKQIKKELIKFKEYKFLYNSAINDFDNIENQFLLVNNYLDECIKLFNISIYEKIIKEKVDNNKIHKLEEYIKNSWFNECFNNINIYGLFLSLGNYSEQNKILEEDIFVNIGFKEYIEKLKFMLSDVYNYHIVGIPDYGARTARLMDDLFFIKVKENKRNYNFNDLNSKLENIILELKRQNYSPDLIIVTHNLLSEDVSLKKSKKYTDWWSLDKSSQDKGVKAKYDDIPIYCTFSKTIVKNLFICDFKNAFKLKIFNPNDNLKYPLSIDFSELSDNQIEEKYSGNIEKWSKDEFGNTLSKEDSKKMIAAGMLLNINAKVNFEILNEEAFRITNI